MTDNLTNPENVTASAGRDDAITSTASPRPWRVEGPFPGQRETKRQHNFRDYANVLDRNGIYIAQNLPPETAAFIVDAVNALEAVHALSIKLYGPLRKAEDERDRLRKKWEKSARKLVESEAGLYNETKRRIAAEAERDRLAADEARYRSHNVVLRDIVRRLADTLQGILDAAEGRGEGRLDESLIREARAAIGEDD